MPASLGDKVGHIGFELPFLNDELIKLKRGRFRFSTPLPKLVNALGCQCDVALNLVQRGSDLRIHSCKIVCSPSSIGFWKVMGESSERLFASVNHLI